MLFNFSQDWLISMLLSIPAILIAISFHEWAHAFAAYKLGDPTARNMGRMTLNPLKHIDPVGAIMLLLIGVGFAKPVPVNVRNFKKPRRDDIIVSLAGVITNFVLAFLFTGVYMLMLLVFHVTNEIALGIVGACISINIGLGVFNLLPVPPLDGYHVVFRNLLVRKISPQTLWNIERYSGVIVLALLLLMRMFNVNLIGDLVSAIMGWYLSAFIWIFSLFV